MREASWNPKLACSLALLMWKCVAAGKPGNELFSLYPHKIRLSKFKSRVFSSGLAAGGRGLARLFVSHVVNEKPWSLHHQTTLLVNLVFLSPYFY